MHALTDAIYGALADATWRDFRRRPAMEGSGKQDFSRRTLQPGPRSAGCPIAKAMLTIVCEDAKIGHSPAMAEQNRKDNKTEAARNLREVTTSERARVHRPAAEGIDAIA